MLYGSVVECFAKAVGNLIVNGLGGSGNQGLLRWLGGSQHLPPQPDNSASTVSQIMFDDLNCPQGVFFKGEQNQRLGIQSLQSAIFQSVCVSWQEVYTKLCRAHIFYTTLMFNNSHGLITTDRDEELCRSLLVVEMQTVFFIQTLGWLFLQPELSLLGSPCLPYLLLSLECHLRV
jgi:hypothetical protein